MSDNIKELIKKYYDLVEKSTESQRTTCRLTGEREQVKSKLVKALELLFETNAEYFCPWCSNPLYLSLMSDSDKYRLGCKCGYRGQLFDTELYTLLDWFNKCNLPGGRDNVKDQYDRTLTDIMEESDLNNSNN